MKSSNAPIKALVVSSKSICPWFFQNTANWTFLALSCSSVCYCALRSSTWAAPITAISFALPLTRAFGNFLSSYLSYRDVPFTNTWPCRCWGCFSFLFTEHKIQADKCRASSIKAQGASAHKIDNQIIDSCMRKSNVRETSAGGLHSILPVSDCPFLDTISESETHGERIFNLSRGGDCILKWKALLLERYSVEQICCYPQLVHLFA